VWCVCVCHCSFVSMVFVMLLLWLVEGLKHVTNVRV